MFLFHKIIPHSKRFEIVVKSPQLFWLSQRLRHNLITSLHVYREVTRLIASITLTTRRLTFEFWSESMGGSEWFHNTCYGIIFTSFRRQMFLFPASSSSTSSSTWLFSWNETKNHQSCCCCHRLFENCEILATKIFNLWAKIQPRFKYHFLLIPRIKLEILQKCRCVNNFL